MRISDWSSDVCSSDLAYSFDKRIIHIIWMLRDHAAQAFQHLADCLMKLRLPGLTPQDFSKKWLQFFVNAYQIYTPRSEFLLTRTEDLGGSCYRGWDSAALKQDLSRLFLVPPPPPYNCKTT